MSKPSKETQKTKTAIPTNAEIYEKLSDLDAHFKAIFDGTIKAPNARETLESKIEIIKEILIKNEHLKLNYNQLIDIIEETVGLKISATTLRKHYKIQKISKPEIDKNN